MKFKVGSIPPVSIKGISPEMAIGLFVADQIFASFGVVMTITSGVEGVHSAPNTLHPKGRAADLRTNGIPETTVLLIVKRLKDELGHVGFQFVRELGSAPHIHMEFDPKG